MTKTARRAQWLTLNNLNKSLKPRGKLYALNIIFYAQFLFVVGRWKVMILIKIIRREFGIKHQAERFAAPSGPTVLL